MSDQKKLVIMRIISFIVVILPITVFLVVNNQLLTTKRIVSLSLAGSMGFSLVLLAIMCKVKIRAGVWICFVAVVSLIFANIGMFMGYGLLCVGGGLSIDAYVLEPIRLHYKEKILERRGKKVTYTRELK